MTPLVHAVLVCLPLVVTRASCGDEAPVKPPTPSVVYDYDFSTPVLELKLPKRLEEISGLTIVDDTLVAAVQDEKGEIFLLDHRTGDVVDKFKFARDGDFEGIELVDDTMYVLRSDGDVYVIADWRSKDPEAKKIETYLATKNDTEGLGYQPSKQRLLIVAKEFPGRGRSRVRSIYGFDLRTKKVDPEPVYEIPLDTIGVRLGLPGEAIRNLLAPALDLESFKPAAVAVHPRTGDIFVVSSVLKVIVVLSPSGELIQLSPIDIKDLPQPEGLAFLPNGDLLVSSEGAGGRGRLFRFNERKTSTPPQEDH